jgi:hypothetical protein
VVDLVEKQARVFPLVLASNGAVFAVARAAQELAYLRRFRQARTRRPGEAFALRWGAVEPDAAHDIAERIVSDREDLRFSV